MALVLSASMPSGDPAIVNVRNELSALMAIPRDVSLRVRPPPCLLHIDYVCHSYPLPYLYIGNGTTDCQLRPSQWSNPYTSLVDDPEDAYEMFVNYL